MLAVRCSLGPYPIGAISLSASGALHYEDQPLSEDDMCVIAQLTLLPVV
jgi:hypothetical protein